MFPVDASITAFNKSNDETFTVWNDRPQAGAVHYNGTIKLLIDRRVGTVDNGGVDDLMYEYETDEQLSLNFKVKPNLDSEMTTEVA